MTNQLLQIELELRLNKLGSFDYQNIPCWQKAAAFNKAMDAWVSRQLEGINQTRSTAEGSIRSIDKLRTILTQAPLTATPEGLYWEASLPDDYVEWSRVSTMGSSPDGCCPPRKFVVYLGEEADIDIDLRDKNKQPSYEWGETIGTIVGDTVRIYTNKCFDIVDPSITYYRAATHVQFAGCTNPDTGLEVFTDVECEFSTNITETILDEAAAILSNDMDNVQKKQILDASAEHSN